MASNNTRGNGERATSRCTDADLYGGVNVLAGDGFESQVYSKEIHADAVKLSVRRVRTSFAHTKMPCPGLMSLRMGAMVA
ncbi:hypothetical protein VPH35_131159 [Triticum aestivum]